MRDGEGVRRIRIWKMEMEMEMEMERGDAFLCIWYNAIFPFSLVENTCASDGEG
jgi:hypothetical protein